MSDTTTAPVQTSDGSTPRLPLVREVFAGLIALFILALFFWMMTKAFGYIEGNNAQNLDAIKELLAIINPVIGLIIGYYFSRMTTEARAEAAEKTAQTSAAVAERASAGRDQAVRATETVRRGSLELASALTELTNAAEALARPRLSGEGLESVTADQQSAVATARLAVALERARHTIAQHST